MRPQELSDQALEAALARIGEEVDFPPTPSLHRAVRLDIESGAKPAPPARLWLRPALVGAAALLVAFGLTLTLFPRARDAVADFIGLGGVRIDFGDRAPSVVPGELNLGGAIDLTAAEERVGFDVKVPTAPHLGLYTVHVTEPPKGGMVSLFFGDQYPGRRPPDLLITQFRASLKGGFFKKLVFEGAATTHVEVRDHDGYWVRGAHFFYYFDGTAPAPRKEDVRLAANVLLWEEDGITYRIEADIPLREALRIAGSLR